MRTGHGIVINGKQARDALSGPKRHKHAGFTLIELAMVLIIAGLIIGIGLSTWMSMIDVRRYSKTVSALTEVKNCLLERAYVSERYPSYSATNMDCAAVQNDAYDVDYCLCENNIEDAWGNGLYFLEGRDTSNAVLNGKPVVSDTARDQTRADVHANSRATDSNGQVQDDVAFILISFGEDGEADDNSNYNTLFGSDRVETMSTVNTPDFSVETDIEKKDVAIIVTSYELAAQIRK